MKSSFSFIKATVLGGLFFLVPIGMVLLLVGKIVPVLAKIEKALGGTFPTDSTLGMIALNLAAVAVILFFCFLAGLAAQCQAAKRIVLLLEEKVLGAVPGYAFVKGFTQSMQETDEKAESFTPVLVRFDDYDQVAFEMERIADTGRVVIYLPGAPNPWSGSIIYVDPDRVTPLNMSVTQVVKNIKQLGRGSSRSRATALGLT